MIFVESCWFNLRQHEGSCFAEVRKFVEGKDKVKDAKRGTATCLVIGPGVAGMDAKEGTDTGCRYLEQSLKASEPVKIMITLSKRLAHPRFQNGFIAHLGNHSANYLVPFNSKFANCPCQFCSRHPFENLISAFR